MSKRVYSLVSSAEMVSGFSLCMLAWCGVSRMYRKSSDSGGPQNMTIIAMIMMRGKIAGWRQMFKHLGMALSYEMSFKLPACRDRRVQLGGFIS